MAGITHTKAHKALISVIIASRKEAGLDQAGFAKRMKWAPQSVSQLETGQRGLQAAELPLVAKALEIDELQLYKRWLAFRGQ